MKRNLLRLREVIWQVTGKCNNGCKYCGSKSAWKQGNDQETIKQIASQIAATESIQKLNVSGGDPMLISLQTHKFIVDSFKTPGYARPDRKIAVIVNPKSVSYEKVILYDFFGLSVNTKEQLKLAETWVEKRDHKKQVLNMTVITNFNTQNIFLFDKIKRFVRSWNATWQVQYTVVNSTINPELAIYDNDEAYQYLKQKLLCLDVKVVIADNMSDGPCGAGTYSCGILNNGDVVPCLSMRDWRADVRSTIQGNVLSTKLRKIWKDGFQKYRFEQFECCKDVCKNKSCPSPAKLSVGGGQPIWIPQEQPGQIHVYYGVFVAPDKKFPPGNIMAYAVIEPNVNLYAAYDNTKSNIDDIRMVYGARQ